MGISFFFKLGESFKVPHLNGILFSILRATLDGVQGPGTGMNSSNLIGPKLLNWSQGLETNVQDQKVAT